MHVASFLSIFLLALSRSTHADHSADSHQFQTDNGVCGDTIWENRTSSNSPLVSSCVNFVKQLREDPGYGFLLGGWVKDDPDPECQGLGDCGFDAKVFDPDGRQIVPISHADMADLVEDAMKFSSADQRVGASGVMDCSAEGQYTGKIYWRVDNAQYEGFC
ncbi:hypothetical protein F5Y07DRAFT_379769 [Xylaria sp. FL0933]|nr:hypothetical protein F5Y07DRAFT_379769 [Xylaria sp. FL0933]